MRVLPLLAFLVCAGPALAAPQFATIYTFPPTKDKDASFPVAPLTAGPDGVLYGTTTGGGKKDYGTIFELTPPSVPGAQWTRQTIHTFKGDDEAGRPSAKMIFDQNTGALLGTASGQEGGGDYGAVFRLVPPSEEGKPWTMQVVHTFAGGTDGIFPFPGLVQDPATGAVYGATIADPFDQTYPATLYGFTPDASHQNWTRTLSYGFAAGDGTVPSSDLVLNDGILYGMTFDGGIVNDQCSHGCGTIFSYDLATNTFATLFQSHGAPEPTMFSSGTPLLGDASDLIGTSSKGAGGNCRLADDCGTVFTMKLDGSAAPTVTARLKGKNSGSPDGGVVWNMSHTALYGASDGLPNRCHHKGCGAIFQLKQRKSGKWKLSVVHAFDGTDGGQPIQLVLGADGAFYGTTPSGGANKTGTIFRIDP